jgi:hypothetical protein
MKFMQSQQKYLRVASIVDLPKGTHYILVAWVYLQLMCRADPHKGGHYILIAWVYLQLMCSCCSFLLLIFCMSLLFGFVTMCGVAGCSDLQVDQSQESEDQSLDESDE